MEHTLACSAQKQPVQVIRRTKKQIHMCDEFFRSHDTVHVCAIANMQQHIGDASGRLFLKARERAPDPKHFFLDLFLAVTHGPTHLFGRVIFGHWLLLIEFVGLVEAYVPVLVDHVALGVPVLVLAVAKYLDKLLENGGMASVASLRKSGRVVVVAVDISFMFVVAILGAKNGGADGAGKVFNVVFAFEGGNVGATERATTCKAEQVETLKVVGLAQRILVRRMVGKGEELARHNLVTVLEVKLAKRDRGGGRLW